jgi:hypothetical protein
VATLEARNANAAVVTPMVGSGGARVLGRSPETGGRFCVGAFGRNPASVAVQTFSPLIFFIKKLDECCTFNAICKANAAINRSTLQHKNFIPRQLRRAG